MISKYYFLVNEESWIFLIVINHIVIVCVVSVIRYIRHIRSWQKFSFSILTFQIRQCNTVTEQWVYKFCWTNNRAIIMKFVLLGCLKVGSDVLWGGGRITPGTAVPSTIWYLITTVQYEFTISLNFHRHMSIQRMQLSSSSYVNGGDDDLQISQECLRSSQFIPSWSEPPLLFLQL